MKKILALFGLLMLFACSEKPATLDGEYKMLNAPDNADITIGFDGSNYFGKSAINRYSGTFKKDGTKIKFDMARSTLMAGPENLMKIEQQYLQNLSKVTSFSLTKNQLTLKGDNVNLSFAKQTDTVQKNSSKPKQN